MKFYLLPVIAMLVSFSTEAQDVAPLLTEAAKLEKDLKENEALDLYKTILKIQPGNSVALFRASELTGRIGSRVKDDKQKIVYYTTARYYAEEALKQKENFADAFYVLAYTSLRLSSVNKGKEKAMNLRDMKYYTDSALLFTPNHPGALYLLGKWNFEIYGLNTAEKAAVKVLFGGMPKASLGDAISNFEKARMANPWMLVNYLDLANAYIKDHKTDKAIEVLNKMVKMPPRTGDDESLKAEGRKLLAALQ